jgi:hypothetical protein
MRVLHCQNHGEEKVSSNIDPGDAAYRAWQLTKNGERMAQYGHPFTDYTMVRRIFGVLTNFKHNLTVQEAIMFMVAVKLARLMKSLDNEKMHEDSLVDAIGYLNCLHMADARDQLLDAPLHVLGDMEFWRDKPTKA